MRSIYIGSDDTPERFLRALLDLADDPQHVVWVVGENRADVPDYLADRYFAAQDPEPEPDPTPARKRAARKKTEE
jgi:hypothetical protein